MASDLTYSGSLTQGFTVSFLLNDSLIFIKCWFVVGSKRIQHGEEITGVLVVLTEEAQSDGRNRIVAPRFIQTAEQRTALLKHMRFIQTAEQRTALL